MIVVRLEKIKGHVNIAELKQNGLNFMRASLPMYQLAGLFTRPCLAMPIIKILHSDPLTVTTVPASPPGSHQELIPKVVLLPHVKLVYNIIYIHLYF